MKTYNTFNVAVNTHLRCVPSVCSWLQYLLGHSVISVFKLVSIGLLTCDAVWTCSWIPSFQRNSSEDGSSMFFQNIGIYLQAHMVLNLEDKHLYQT